MLAASGSGTVFHHEDYRAEGLEASRDRLRGELRRRSCRRSPRCRPPLFAIPAPDPGTAPVRASRAPQRGCLRLPSRLCPPRCGSEEDLEETLLEPSGRVLYFLPRPLWSARASRRRNSSSRYRPTACPCILFFSDPRATRTSTGLRHDTWRPAALRPPLRDREPIWGTAAFVWGADVRQEGQQ